MYYIIFRGYNHYPSGGLNDMEYNSFRSFKECQEIMHSDESWDWYQIVLVTCDGLQIVESRGC